MTTPPNSRHEETIRPVEPGLRRRAASAEPAARRPGPGRGALALLATGLGAAAIGVFVWLPQWVGERAAEPGPAVATPAAGVETSPSEPQLSAERLAELRAEAETLLAELLTQQQRLERQGPDAWAAEEWARYRTLAREGDDAYLDEDYAVAVPAYTEALAIGEALAGQARTLIEQALADGYEALAAGEPDVAAERFRFALSIDAEQADAAAGLARAEQLPDVLEAFERGAEHERRRELEQAAAAYREAATIDPQWARATAALDSVRARIEDQRFDTLLSDGMTAIGGQEFATAIELFERALAMRPASAAAQDGLEQAEQGMKLDAIALAEVRALAFERRELWDRAIEQYRAALATDDALAFAQRGLERAQARADLDAKLANLIDNPSLLFRDQILEEARALLAQARDIDAAGPRLGEQIAALDRLLVLASTPVEVRLESDGRTHVTLYRVGELGAFAAKQLELRPGHYTAVGSRNGYRDVRETFTVLPGREPPVVTVQCVEPI